MYRELSISFFLFCIVASAFSQCISGDCDNGIGTTILKEGTYVGSFKNGLPNGQGVFTGKFVRARNLDSIQDTGTFIDGFFLEGKRKTIARWYLETEWADARGGLAARGYKPYGNAWMVPKNITVTTDAYPERGEYTRTQNRKETVYKTWDYYAVNVNGRLRWTGKLKNGKFDGTADLEFGERSITMTFNEGIPVGSPIIQRGSNGYDLGWLEGFTIQDGLVVEQTIQIGDDRLVQKVGRSIYEMVQNSELGYPFGNFTRYYKDGSTYTGSVVRGLPDGLGKYTFINGDVFEGFYFKDLRQGPGVATTKDGSIDSGFYFLNKFVSGNSTRPGKGTFKFPICLSGNCENGAGKARYTTRNTDTSDNVYSGNFVNGLPSGYGEWRITNGKYTSFRKGNFANGALNGSAETEANGGLIRKLRGTFLNDTLVGGIVTYDDGSSYECAKPERPVVFGVTKAKVLSSSGIYRSAQGTVLTGSFNMNANVLMRGRYENASGIVISDFGYENDPYAYLRLSSYAYDIDRIDYYVKSIVAQLKWDEQKRKELAIAFQKQKERESKFSTNYNDPNNFENTSGNESCAACNGSGKFVYSNTFDGNYIKEYYDSRGDKKQVEVQRTGRTYVTKVKCSACNGTGKIFQTSKKYVGPAY